MKLLIKTYATINDVSLHTTLSTRNFWIHTIAISLILCGAGLGELIIRRQTPANLYLLNKSIATTAILLIAGSYVLSALHTFGYAPKRILAYRRYTGLVGYGYALIHIMLTFVVPNPTATTSLQFPFPDYFIERPIAFLSACIALILFTYACWLSITPQRFNGTAVKARSWRMKLRYGYLGVILIGLHVTILKTEGWLKWIQTQTPALPPLSLITALILVGIIILKTLQLRKERRIFKSRLPEKVGHQE